MVAPGSSGTDFMGTAGPGLEDGEEGEEDGCSGPERSVSWRRFSLLAPSSWQASCLESLRSLVVAGRPRPRDLGDRSGRGPLVGGGCWTAQPESPPGLWTQRSMGAAMLQSLVAVAWAG